MISGSEDNTIKIWNLEECTLTHNLENNGCVVSMILSKNEKKFTTCLISLVFWVGN